MYRVLKQLQQQRKQQKVMQRQGLCSLPSQECACQCGTAAGGLWMEQDGNMADASPQPKAMYNDNGIGFTISQIPKGLDSGLFVQNHFLQVQYFWLLKRNKKFLHTFMVPYPFGPIQQLAARYTSPRFLSMAPH